MNRLRHVRSYRIYKIAGLFISLIALIFVVPFTYSRYETRATADVRSQVAYYLLDTDYVVDSVKITDLVPSDTPYIYYFTIANNDGINRLETRLEYDLKIRTTTNLPLSFELYMNEDYDNPSSVNIVGSGNTVTDTDGTYFKEFIAPKEYFSFTYDEVNNYTLVVYFPKMYSSYQYQGLIDSIEITIDSKQILD